jgi:transcriptional regulator with XRE-family HTH domain
MHPIKRYREARGLTQRQLADQIGRSPSFLSHVENGDYLPSTKTLLALSRVLGVPISDLLGDDTRYAFAADRETSA